MNGDSLSNTQKLVSPYKGRLVNLVVTEEERAAAMHRASTLPSAQLSPRSLCDIELLSTGAFSPLEQFMCRADYERVLDQMRLADGTLFPIPIILPIEVSHAIEIGKEVALRSPKNELIAIMIVEEIFDWNLLLEALVGFGVFQDIHFLKLKRVLRPERGQLLLEFIAQAAIRLAINYHINHGKLSDPT